jgi:hypothetical protein
MRSALLAVVLVGASAGDLSWWFYENKDCDYQDVLPAPSCAGKKHTIAELKACCSKTAGCGGVNTNGIIKNTSCANHMNPPPSPCNLYVLKSGTQPPTPAPAPPAIVPQMWPAPKFAAYGSPRTNAYINPNTFKFLCSATSTSNTACKDTITAAFTRAKSNAFYFTGEVNTTGATLATLTVKVLAEKATDLQLGVNESYTLSINQTDAVIIAQTEWGALHGIESFVSLVGIEPWEQPVRYFLRNDVPLNIADEPRVRWRGKIPNLLGSILFTLPSPVYLSFCCRHHDRLCTTLPQH